MVVSDKLVRINAHAHLYVQSRELFSTSRGDCICETACISTEECASVRSVRQILVHRLVNHIACDRGVREMAPLSHTYICAGIECQTKVDREDVRHSSDKTTCAWTAA